MHVTKIKQIGVFDTVRVQHKTYDVEEHLFRTRFGAKIPQYNQLRKMFSTDPENLRILATTLKFVIYLANGDILFYEFFPGFIWDFASIVKLFRSILDNDDIELMPGAIIHDRNFSVHVMSFTDTNDLFYEMIKHQINYPWNNKRMRRIRLKAWIAYNAVSSMFGKFFWRKRAIKRLEYTLQFSRFTRIPFGTSSKFAIENFLK